MQFLYVTISKRSEKLLLEIEDIYLENSRDQDATALEFQDRYFIPGESRYPKDIEDCLHELYEAKYLEDAYTLRMSPQGLHFRLCKWLYWKPRAIVPLSVSVVSSIIVNIVIALANTYL